MGTQLMHDLGWLLMPDMGLPDSPYLDLIVGFVFFSVGVASTLAGKVPAKRWIYRDKEPFAFWFGSAFWYLVGVSLIFRSLVNASQP